MALFEQLRDALNYGDEVDVSHLLTRLPQPPSEALAHPLLDIIRALGPEVALQAAELLASMRHGAGNLFLVEALTEPGLRVASQLIDLLDLGSLGPAWGRIPRVLLALGSRSRAHLVRRLLQQPDLVPAKLWRTVLLHAEPNLDLEAILELFATLAGDTQGNSGPDCHAQRSTEHAMAHGLLARLKADRDPIELQRKLARLLMRVIARHRFISREFMKMLATDGVCQRNRAVLAELVRDVGVLSETHVNTAVPSLVALACCDDDELAQAALSTLHELTELGTALDWQPLLTCPRDNAQLIAMRAFELQPGDVSSMARLLLSDADASTRRGAVAMLNHRLLRGRAVGIESWQHYARLIAHDPDPTVALSLDVESLLRHTSDLTRFHAVLELLRTPYAPLLGRVLTTLRDKGVWRAVAPAGRGDLLSDALFDALAGVPGLLPVVEASTREVNDGADKAAAAASDTTEGTPWFDSEERGAALAESLVKLLGRMSVAHVVAAADRIMPRLSPELRRFVAERLGHLNERRWQEHCALYLRLLDDAARPAAATPRPRARAWVLLGALHSPHPRVRVRALRALGRLENAAVLGHVAALLADPDAGVRKAAATALGTLRHPDALVAIEAATASAPELTPVAIGLRRHLARPEEPPFAWPAAVPIDEETVGFEVWERSTGWLTRRRSWWAGRLGGPTGEPAPMGTVVVSDHALWLRDRRRDEVVLWRAPMTLTVTRGAAAGEWGTLLLQLAQDRSYGTIVLTCGTWVRRSPALDGLPEGPEDLAVFVRSHQASRFLGLLRDVFARFENTEASALIESLAP